MSSPAADEPVTGAAAPPLPNPFHGLRRFEIEDSGLFFGRDEQTYEVLRRLRLLHFVAVLGPSGCGKSSLIRAGVLAALQGGYMADEGEWRIVMLQPGNGPLEAWSRALRPHLREGKTEEDLLTEPAMALNTDSGKIAILVDQFEELFHYSDRTGRDRDVRLFLQAMLSVGSGNDSQVHIVITMRTEYLAQCARYPDLAEAINEGLYLVPEMSRDQMREAIVQPVRKVGAEITAPLVDRLLNDATGQADALPVLQHALMRMWSKKRSWEPLGLPEYELQIQDLGPTATAAEIGGAGISAFISGHANEVLAQLDPDEKIAARRVFQILTELTADGRAVRRATPPAEIVSATDLPEERVDRVIQAFRREGFLNVWESEGAGSSLVDITHEAVARQWNTLREWMVVEARTRRHVQRVAEAAKEWNEHSRNRAYLFRGLQLAEAQTYLRGREHRLGDTEREFLHASGTGEVLNRILSPKVLGAALLLMLVLAGLAMYSVNRASLAAQRAKSAQAALQRAQEAGDLARAAEQQAQRSAESASALLSRLKPTEGRSPETAQPRIFIQIRDAGQREQAQVLAGQLRKGGFEVPGIEKVPVGPNATQVRYFRTADEPDARRIVQILGPQHVGEKPVYVQGYGKGAPESHFEIWLVAAAPQKGLNPAQAAAILGPRDTASAAATASRGMDPVLPQPCQPASSRGAIASRISFEPRVPSPLQKIRVTLESACRQDGIVSWKFQMLLWERARVTDGFGDATADVLVDLDGNETNAAATAAHGLDPSQEKQALAAAITLRAAATGAATQKQAMKDVLDIIAVRSDGGDVPQTLGR